MKTSTPILIITSFLTLGCQHGPGVTQDGGVGVRCGSPSGDPELARLLADTGTFLEDMVGAPNILLAVDNLPSVTGAGAPGCTQKSALPLAELFPVLPQIPHVKPVVFPPSTTALKVEVTDDLAGLSKGFWGAALSMEFSFSDTEPFAGVILDRDMDISRYPVLFVRYRTSGAGVTEVKLNHGASSKEEVLELPGTNGKWVQKCYAVASAFPGADLQKVNKLVFATSKDLTKSKTFSFVLDTLSFHGFCPTSPPSTIPPVLQTNTVTCPAGKKWLDLACHEPQSGVANQGVLLTFLAASDHVSPSARKQALMDKVLSSLLLLPGWTGQAGGAPWKTNGWPQNWASPVSLYPSPRDKVLSLTDLGKLYAALMVVEARFGAGHALTLKAERLRLAMKFSHFYQKPAGFSYYQFFGGVDRAKGLITTWVNERLSNDATLPELLALATDAVPVSWWRTNKSLGGQVGVYCTRDQQGAYFPCTGGAAPACCKKLSWYDLGHYGGGSSPVPGMQDGGLFLALDLLLYAHGDRIPVAPLSLVQAARNLMLAQRCYGLSRKLPYWGWSNAREPEGGAYVSCTKQRCMVDSEVVPHATIMGMDLLPAEVKAQAKAFLAAKLDAPFSPYSKKTYRYGLRSSYCQAAGKEGLSAPHNYLVLEQGFLGIGLLNCLHKQVVRELFSSHPVADKGYNALAAAGAKQCP